MAKAEREANRRRRPAGGAAEQRRRVVGVLIGVCGSLERLQRTEAAREACREVARRLRALRSEPAEEAG